MEDERLGHSQGSKAADGHEGNCSVGKSPGASVLMAIFISHVGWAAEIPEKWK